MLDRDRATASGSQTNNETNESFGDILSQYEQAHSHRPDEGGKGLEGTVIAVAPSGTLASGVVSFPVSIAVQNPKGILGGMTSTANITCASGNCNSAGSPGAACSSGGIPCWCTADTQCPGGKCVNWYGCATGACTGGGAGDGFNCVP